MSREAMKTALEALDNSIDTVWNEYLDDWRHGLPTRKAQLEAKLKMVEDHEKAITAIKAALAQPAQEPVLQDIEQYRMQIAGICTAAIGYWKEGDSIHPDYDTLALRDVAKLYAKYDALYTPPQRQPLTDGEIDELSRTMVKGNKSVNWLCRAIEAAHGIGDKT